MWKNNIWKNLPESRLNSPCWAPPLWLDLRRCVGNEILGIYAYTYCSFQQESCLHHCVECFKVLQSEPPIVLHFLNIFTKLRVETQKTQT